MNRPRRILRRLTPRALRRSIGARVLMGFALTAALTVVVAFVSLWYSSDAGRGLARVTERDRAIGADFRDIEAAVEQQSGAVQNFLLSGDDRDLGARNAGRDRFYTALDRLQVSLPAEERGAALEELRHQAQAFDEIALEEIALSEQGWGRSANFLWRTDGQKVKQDLLAAIKRQVDEHNAGIDREIDASRAHLRFVYGVALLLVTLAAAIACVVGMTITRAVTEPVRNLMQVAAAVRGGDYSVRTPVRGEDELAVLSLSMNAMVHSLAASRAELEHALADTERSEERYRILTENANDIIYALDRENRITFVNPAVRHVLGYEPDEIAGRPATVLLTERTEHQLADQGIPGGQRPDRFTADIELIAKDGRVVPMEISSSVMYVGGEAVGVQGIARDMTERHAMEQELRRLHGQGQRRVDQLLTLNEVGRNIAALQPVDTLLPHLAQTLGRTFGYHHVRILLVNEGARPYTAGAWHKEHMGSMLAEDDRSVFEDGEVSPLAIRAMEGDAGFVAGSGRPEDDAAIRYTEVAVPVRTKTGVLGVLDIRGSAEGPLDESDIFTLQTLADQVAVAIENARLYETGQRLAVSEERNRLARELHDSVTQELFSMTMMAGALPALIERKPAIAHERAGRLYDLAKGALAEMRDLLFALRPAALADEGLVSALTKHAEAFQNREAIATHVEIDGGGRLPQACEEALYRVAQEALNNVSKHAHARNAWVTLAIGDDETTLSIRDDGVGMDVAAFHAGHTRSLGMTTMRERIEALGGIFTVESSPGAGATIRVTVPAGVPEPATP